MDRELYLPTSWTEDAGRCAAAGIPAEVGFATKPQLGVEMLARTHAAGVLAGWVTVDEAFDQNRVFRGWLAARACRSCSPLALTTPSHVPTAVVIRRATWLRWTARTRGNAARPGRAGMANGSTTGPSSRWTRRASPMVSRRDGVIGCWFADRSTRHRARLLSWRSTVARAQRPRRYPS